MGAFRRSFLPVAGLLWLAARTIASPGAPQAGPAPGLIAHWDFDGPAGSPVYDRSGHGADLAPHATVATRGVRGGAVEFDGRGAYLEAGDPAAADITGGFTICFWIKPASWVDQYSAGVVSKRANDGAPGYVIYADGFAPSKINLRISGTQGGYAMLTSASDVEPGVWQHWAVVHDPVAHSLAWYKNGRLDKLYRSIVIGDTSNPTRLQVGHAHTWNGFLDGSLDDLRVYARPLALTEVRALAGGGLSGPSRRHPTVRWRLVHTRYPTQDAVVAGLSVREAGAAGDGRTDDTEAFQSALTALARVGGGTLLVPQGRYAIRGNLSIPTGVTLRGERPRSTVPGPVRGAVLMAYAGRGMEDGRPFIALRQCSGVRDLSIWYPEQRADGIVPYPYAIEQMGAASGTVQDVTLVNAYQGIRTNYGSYLHYFHGVCGSPLKTGIEIGFVSDTGRVDTIAFSPDFWSASQLPGSPRAGGAHAAWMRANGTGMLFRRYEWIYSAFVRLAGYATGIRMVNSQRMGETNGQMYEYDISKCGTGVEIVDANFAGISFTRCRIAGDDYGVVTQPTFNTRLLFHTCRLSGRVAAARLDGIVNQTVAFQRCMLSGEVVRPHGDLVMMACRLAVAGNHISLGEAAHAVTIAGCDFGGAPRISNRCRSGRVTISMEAVPSREAPRFVLPIAPRQRPAGDRLVVVQPRPATGSAVASDDSARIRKAMLDLAHRGGGVVFLPAGLYSLRGNLEVPSGVELRGVYDVNHHTRGWGSIVQVFAGRGTAAGRPAVALLAGSGLRGLTFCYPGQRLEAIVPYPFLVQGRGAGVYVVNVTAVNPYQFVDLASHRCDRHYVEYAAGAPLRTGIAVGGGSVGGAVLNTQFNSHYWAWSPLPTCPGVTPAEAGRGHNPVWAYQYQNLDAFTVGYCVGERQYQNTVFGSRNGLRFVAQQGRGASGAILGHGSDGSLVPMAFDRLGAGGIDVINSQLVSMDCRELPPSPGKRYITCGPMLRAQARMVNSTLWGTPAISATVEGGELQLDLAALCGYGPIEADGGLITMQGVWMGGSPFTPDKVRTRRQGTIQAIGCVTPTGLKGTGVSATLDQATGW